ncbi:hypothetical protein Q2K19_32125 [Micromonospora soli]|uniref:hypothetical protein n=1 Tax=Micromonospora sp. NBRC 110009 TaxID=3061627 RepID=UPI002671DA81|nr:hypothetical protein [Micromonospora sp. NBRC 110009]WKT98733.1 hypothetical protein Q2K19_32125 [Micromonospora sp. NBRC 110009]
MDRQKLRRVADGLPLVGVSLGLGRYLIDERLLGHDGGGLAAVGVEFVGLLVISWVLRKVSGMTWREALWLRREPPPWSRLPPSMALVNELAQAGKKIQAIKMYRELTGASLVAGKEAVEAMIVRHSLP